VADYKLDVYHGDDGLDELLKRDDIHAVIIALPIPKQPEIVEKALRAGKHVLSEKPIGPDVASAKKLVEMYESEFKNKGQNLEWRVAENFAHEPAVLRAANPPWGRSSTTTSRSSTTSSPVRNITLPNGVTCPSTKEVSSWTAVSTP
jgi:hypothetical protein